MTLNQHILDMSPCSTHDPVAGNGKNHWIASTLLGLGGCHRRQLQLHHKNIPPTNKSIPHSTATRPCPVPKTPISRVTTTHCHSTLNQHILDMSPCSTHDPVAGNGKNHWIASTLLGHSGCLRRLHLLHYLTPNHHILGTTSHYRHTLALPQQTHGNIGAHSRSVQQHIIAIITSGGKSNILSYNRSNSPSALDDSTISIASLPHPKCPSATAHPQP